MLTLRRCWKLVRISLILLPMITCGLWLVSGRETFTKPRRAIEVELEADLFGDVSWEMQLIPGPILGYYIGLDAVAVSGAMSFILFGTTEALRRIRRQRLGSPEQAGTQC